MFAHGSVPLPCSLTHQRGQPLPGSPLRTRNIVVLFSKKPLTGSPQKPAQQGLTLQIFIAPLFFVSLLQTTLCRQSCTSLTLPTPYPTSGPACLAVPQLDAPWGRGTEPWLPPSSLACIPVTGLTLLPCQSSHEQWPPPQPPTQDQVVNV